MYIYPTVTDDVAVVRVEVLVNDIIYRSFAEPPYDTYVRMDRGTYTIQVRAADAAGNIGFSVVQSVTRE